MHQRPEGNIYNGISALPKREGLFRPVFDRGAHKVVLCLRKTRFLRLKVPQGVDKIVRRRFTHQGFREIIFPQRKLREKEAAQRRTEPLRAKQRRQIRAAGLPEHAEQVPVQREGGNQAIRGDAEFRRERLSRKEEQLINQAVVVRADTPHGPICRAPVQHFVQSRNTGVRRYVIGHKTRAARFHSLPKGFRLNIVHLVSRRNEAAHQAERGVRVTRIGQVHHQYTPLFAFHLFCLPPRGCFFVPLNL